MQWYEDEVKHLENTNKNLTYTPETLFYGSSSIRLWQSLYTDFADFKPLNLGFGGSTLEACDWFFDRIMAPYHPKRLVIYAGDNDLGDGRQPEEVFFFFQQLAAKTAARFGAIPGYFISLKPSIARQSLIDLYRQTNTLIKNETAGYAHWHFVNIFDKMLDANGNPGSEFFTPDGLHLSKKGYALWAEVVYNCIAEKG